MGAKRPHLDKKHEKWPKCSWRHIALSYEQLDKPLWVIIGRFLVHPNWPNPHTILYFACKVKILFGRCRCSLVYHASVVSLIMRSPTYREALQKVETWTSMPGSCRALVIDTRLQGGYCYCLPRLDLFCSVSKFGLILSLHVWLMTSLYHFHRHSVRGPSASQQSGSFCRSFNQQDIMPLCPWVKVNRLWEILLI